MVRYCVIAETKMLNSRNTRIDLSSFTNNWEAGKIIIKLATFRRIFPECCKH